MVAPTVGGADDSVAYIDIYRARRYNEITTVFWLTDRKSEETGQHGIQV